MMVSEAIGQAVAHLVLSNMSARRLSHLWDSIADRGREILAARKQAGEAADVERLCRDLLSERGEAAGTALARELVEKYEAMPDGARLEFFELLLAQFSPNAEEVLRAADAYRGDPGADALLELIRVVEPPRQELMRRINMAPRGTAVVVEMRRTLLGHLASHPELRAVEEDVRHLLRSWFNRGFLVLERIEWGTPAAILEKIIAHEAVHEIKGWDDMRRRLAEDRRCFAFFHPALPDEPLIFVEVALLDGLAATVGPLLDRSAPTDDTGKANTAVFYSINNCQEGLRGISFGNFLLKQVIRELVEELPRLRRFGTLSPVPGFCEWIEAHANDDREQLTEDELSAIEGLRQGSWHRTSEQAEPLRKVLLGLCAHYLLEAKCESGEPLDAVARFHLGNGASLERINWRADLSARGIGLSAGIMVNYVYRPHQIESNHESYVQHGKIASSSAVRALARRG